MIPVEQNIEAYGRTISPSQDAHQARKASADAISKRSWAQANEEAEAFDINQPLSPRAEDNKLDSGDVNDLDTHDDNLPRGHDDYSPSSSRPSSISSHSQKHRSPPPLVNPSSLKDTKGKGREDGSEVDEDTTNDADNEDDAASKVDNDAIDVKKHSHPRKLKKTKKRKPEPEPEDPVVLKEHSLPPDLQGLQMEISSRPEGDDKVIVTEEPPSPNLARSKLRILVGAIGDVLNEMDNLEEKPG